MKALAVNGSPRRNWNTATLLEKALEGAASAGAETELVHLYDLNYRGCVSCFACKVKGTKSVGRCGYRDGLSPVLDQAIGADVLILGSPIYFGVVTGEMRSFQERLLFPLLTYTDPPGSLYSGSARTGFIYTLGATEEMARERGFDHHIERNETVMKMIFRSCETLCSYDTYQFDDYEKYEAPRFNPAEKARRRAEVFPIDCRKAFDLGVRLAEELR